MNTLAEIPKCTACQMELLPFLDVNDKRILPEVFCDDACRTVYKLYHTWFENGRSNYVSPYRTRPTIDISL